MDCRDCSRYDPDARTCRDGKVNPSRYESAVHVAGVMGIRAICLLNDHRERLLQSRGRHVPLSRSPRLGAKKAAGPRPYHGDVVEPTRGDTEDREDGDADAQDKGDGCQDKCAQTER